MTVHPETVETTSWDNRTLLLRIYYQVVETNGTVRLHEREIYGDAHLGIVGLRQIATENCAYRERMKVGLRIAFMVLGTAASILAAILVLLVQHII
jgi:NH3-dependent NAD+ synthetase